MAKQQSTAANHTSTCQKLIEIITSSWKILRTLFKRENMLLKDTKPWLDENDKSGLLFLVQRLDELTYPYTIDSYRVPTTNVPFLVAECLRVLKDYEEHDVNPAHIDRIWEELENRMSGNFIAHSLLRVPWIEYQKVDRKNFEALQEALSVLSVELQPLKYLQTCLDSAKMLKPKELEKFELIAREITTTLVNCGLDASWISKLIEKHFYSEESKDNAESIDDFFKDLIPKSRYFDVHLTITTDARRIKKEITEIFDITFSDTDKMEKDKRYGGLSAAHGESFISISEISAPDPFTALRIAKRNIARMHDLYGLFYHKGSYQIGEIAHVTQKEVEGGGEVFRANINSMEFIRDNKRGYADRKLELLIQKVKLPTGSDADKFFRVVDFHGMSLGSKVPENQLINLWTSLETIAPSQKGKSIIGSVVDGIVPFICLQYFSKLYTNIAKDLKRWNDQKYKEVLGSTGIDLSAETSEKAFKLIVLRENDAACTKLLSQMDDFPLLRYRIFEMNKKAQKGESISAWIAAHQRRVEQQLYRIYRTRNSIVHSASESTSIEHLIVSAHDYFDQTFALSSAMCGRPYGFSNYVDCFRFAKMAYGKYKENLRGIGEIGASDVPTVLWKYTDRL